MKPVAFTTFVLRGKFRALGRFGYFETRRPVVLPRSGPMAGADLSSAWPDDSSPFGAHLKVKAVDGETVHRLFPPWPAGTELWVRESARVVRVSGMGEQDLRRVGLCYELDGAEAEVLWPARLHAPVVGRGLPNGCFREAARHIFTVSRVGAQRLSAMTVEQFQAEGMSGSDMRYGVPAFSLRQEFGQVWESLYGTGSFDDSWCWAYALTPKT